MAVTVAANGRQALELIRRDAHLAEGLHVALVDRTLPGVDGGVLASELRAARGGARLPTILLEVDVGTTTGDPAGPAGADATVRKPIHQRALRRAVEQATGTASSGDLRSPAPRQASAMGPSAPYRARVLVAEDNPMSQRVARRILEFLGVDVDIAVDGAKAVEMVAGGRYDLVFMDCNMPGVDGYEATRRIRAGEALGESKRRLPIIALTASVLQEGRSNCFESGMDDFLAKPYEISDVHAMLEKWLHTDRGYPSAA